jgi:hypothetical protein
MGKIMANLNALIAQGAQFAAPPDPFAQYGKMQQLQQGETTNQLNRMQMDEYQRARMEEEGTRNYLRGKDLSAPETRTGLTQFGKTGLAYAKALNEQDAAQATQQKAQVELLGNKLKLLPDAYKMADTPEAYVELHKSIHADPVLGPWLKSTGATPERGFAQIQKAIETGTFDKLRMSSMQSVDQLLDSMKPAKGSNLSQLIAERNALPKNHPDIPILNRAIQKESEFAPRAITNVNMPPAEKAYSTEVGGGAGKQDLEAVNRSRAIPQDFAKIDETLGVLRSGNLNTGLGADLFTVLDKARAQVASDKKAGIRSVNTEYLDSLLGSAVFPQIQALGIGARGMDTPAEREFLRKVMTGTIGLNKDTLIKMTELRRKGLENEDNQFNKQVDEGVFAPYEEAARRKVGKIAIPKSGETSIPAGAIADLKAGRGNAEQFDAIFGKGSAQRVLGGGK